VVIGTTVTTPLPSCQPLWFAPSLEATTAGRLCVCSLPAPSSRFSHTMDPRRKVTGRSARSGHPQSPRSRQQSETDSGHRSRADPQNPSHCRGHSHWASHFFPTCHSAIICGGERSFAGIANRWDRANRQFVVGSETLAKARVTNQARHRTPLASPLCPALSAD